MREKYLKAGMVGLHDYEVVELLLTFAHPRRDTKDLARTLLAEYENIPNLLDALPEDIKNMPGAGETTATLLRLVRDLVETYLGDKIAEKDVFCADSLSRVLSFLKSSLRHQENEVFKVLFFDVRNHLLFEDNLHVGTVNRSAVFPRTIMEEALKRKASSLLFAHNHPGGTPFPSKSDKIVTKHLVKAAGLFDMTVLDHIIIAGDGYFSFAEANLL